MENGLTMLPHSMAISVVVYLMLVHLMKQSRTVAGNRALIVGSLALIYMILFGHALPTGMPMM
jgi:hypothetical protein